MYKLKYIYNLFYVCIGVTALRPQIVTDRETNVVTDLTQLAVTRLSLPIYHLCLQFPVKSCRRGVDVYPVKNCRREVDL